MSKIITMPVDKIDIVILMSIWYKEYMPIMGSEREIDGRKYIDLEDVREVGFKINPTDFDVKARKKILDGRGINDK